MFKPPLIDFAELRCPSLPPAFNGLRILHLSDLHVTRWTRRLDKWRAALAQPAVDLLLITGDLGHRSWHWQKSLATVLRLLEPIHPAMGKFFILGNHDSLKLGAALENHAYRLLQNQAVIFEKPPGTPNAEAPSKNGSRLAIIGLNQHRRIDTDIPAALQQVDPSDFKLFMLHYPDLVHQAAAAGAAICLAGHTHGGQICWPDGSPIIRHDALPNTLCTGIHKVHDTWLVVSRGIGVAGLRMRLFCPPQAMVITLRRPPDV